MNSLEFWSKPGVWIAALGGLLMAVNALRSLTAPVPFATYLGLPLADNGDADMVRVYGLRALFIGLAVAALLAMRDIPALAALMFSAVVMPVGDAVLTARAKAPKATIIRHVVIAILLLVAGILLVAS
jgi:hypothetical protein